MNLPTPITPGEVLKILERLYPDSLLLLRESSGIDDETMQNLWQKVAFSFDPRRRLENIEYLLLIMHEARAVHPRRYLHEVFLPWVGIKRRLQDQMTRIVDDIIRAKEVEAYTYEDAIHIATKVYRPLVADVFDPFMTLLVATYQFIDGSFTTIEDANVGFGERSKAELVEARIRKFGGPTEFLAGYDPIVRNALSHTGNEGILLEPGSILFRNIKRGVPPKIETRRWTHDELHMHVLILLELVMSIDAACDLFGIDCLDTLTEGESILRVAFHAMNKQNRLQIMQEADDKLQKIRSTDAFTTEERLSALSEILFLQYAHRDIPCTRVSFNREGKALLVVVPAAKAAVSEAEMREQVAYLIRYAILARSVFGSLFDKFFVEASLENTRVMLVELEGPALDEYAQEAAGLIDLMADAKVWIENGTVQIVLNEVALAEMEDVQLGPRLPRRGRPLPD